MEPEEQAQIDELTVGMTMSLIQSFGLITGRALTSSGPFSFPVMMACKGIDTVVRLMEKITWSTTVNIKDVERVINAAKKLKLTLEKEMKQVWYQISPMERVTLQKSIDDLKEAYEDLDLVFIQLPNDKEFQEINAKLSGL